MCLIVEKLASQTIKPEFLANVWNRNPHGWGIMWKNRKGNTTTLKGLKFEEFLKAYERVKFKHVFIHMRVTTHGLTNHSNAHPHHVYGDVYMMHNGTFRDKLDYKYDHKSDDSDTVQFVAQVLRPLLVEHGPEYVRDPKFMAEVVKYTHNACKVVFLDSKGFLVVEPNYWSHTLTGLRVSNSYGYSIDNPNHQIGRKATNRQSWLDSEKRYGGTGHNSRTFQEEDNDGELCNLYGDESYLAGEHSNGRSVVTTPSTSEVKKNDTLKLAVNNSNNDNKPPLDIKARLSVQDFDLGKAMFLADATEEEIEELVQVDMPFAAKLIKASLQEIQEYGYSTEKFRLGGSVA